MSQEKMLSDYDRDMLLEDSQAYYARSNFCNFGLWSSQTRNQGEASANLVRALLGKVGEKRGKVLDVACGIGGSTQILREIFQPSDITAINLSTTQLAVAENNAPGCTFLAMDAADLEFPDESFDVILCVEAAFHFDTREKYLREAFRVLKPGGWIVQSDILGTRTKGWGRKGSVYLPPENYLEGPGVYSQMLSEMGYVEVLVEDRTEECWATFRKNLRTAPAKARKAGEAGWLEYIRATLKVWSWTLIAGIWIRRYLLVAAQKPAMRA